MAATYSNDPVNSISGANGGIPSALFMIDMQDWHKFVQLDATPILNAITKDGGAPDVPMDKATWGWSRNKPKSDTLAGSVAAAGTTTFTVTTPEIYQIGNLCLMSGTNKELVKVVDQPSATTIEVERGYAGTTATTYSSGSGIFIVAPSYKEYDPYENSPVTQGESDYNYHQIFQYKIPFSQRAQDIPTYETREFGNDRAKWAAMKLTESEYPLDLEYALINQEVRQAGTQSVSGVMGGILTSTFHANNNTSLAGVPLTPKILLDHIDLMARSSKEPIGKDLVCHHTVARYMYSWFHEMRWMEAPSTAPVATYTKKVETPFGVFNIVPSWNWLKPGTTSATAVRDSILICDLKKFRLTPLSANTGPKMFYVNEENLDYWGTEAKFRADLTLRGGNPYTSGILSGFSTTDTDYPAMI
jgi:hypothetical protein